MAWKKGGVVGAWDWICKMGGWEEVHVLYGRQVMLARGFLHERWRSVE